MITSVLINSFSLLYKTEYVKYLSKTIKSALTTQMHGQPNTCRNTHNVIQNEVKK